jgi:hypothetical protein
VFIESPLRHNDNLLVSMQGMGNVMMQDIRDSRQATPLPPSVWLTSAMPLQARADAKAALAHGSCELTSTPVSLQRDRSRRKQGEGTRKVEC